jgi:putative ABC transport system ATP-binding protein
MLIKLNDVWKTYRMGEIRVDALKNVCLEVDKGEYIAILGPSGSGKSTLMNIIGCLDTPSQGQYFLDDIDVSKANTDYLADIRNNQIGFIFQSFNLLARYNVFNNVELPLIYSGLSLKERRRRVNDAIEMVGLSSRIKHRPSELSGGQKQRVAIARALVNKPSLIIADEPTGNLDSVTGQEIMKVFDDLSQAGNTLCLVTHDNNVADHAQRRIELKDGGIV